MNTRKFEYLETIRETVEQGDYEELKDYVEDIRDAVKQDPDFQELFMELNSGRYQDVIPLIDDIIYKEMQADFERLQAEQEAMDEKKVDVDLSEFSLEYDIDEDMKEEISFEPFDDEGYFEKADEDNF